MAGRWLAGGIVVGPAVLPAVCFGHPLGRLQNDVDALEAVLDEGTLTAKDVRCRRPHTA